MRGEEELPGAEEAVRRWSVGLAGGVVAHERRFQTTATISNGGVIAFFSSFLLVSSFSFLSLCFSPFFILFSLFSLSPLFPFFLFPFPCLFPLFFFSFLPLFLPPLSSVFLGPIYRAKEQGFLLFSWGAGHAAVGRPLGATAKVRLPRFSGRARGGWSASGCG